jgi:hypothetical protein
MPPQNKVSPENRKCPGLMGSSRRHPACCPGVLSTRMWAVIQHLPVIQQGWWGSGIRCNCSLYTARNLRSVIVSSNRW